MMAVLLAVYIGPMNLTVSSAISRSLGATAKGRTMHTTENGKERTRYPLATPFATTKNLHIVLN